MLKYFISIVIAIVGYTSAFAQMEMGLTMITTDNDCVCMPEVKRGSNSLDWYSNRVIGLSPNGETLAFIASHNNSTNIFVKSLSNKLQTVQRTKRQAVEDLMFSPDGQFICFVERSGKVNKIYQTSAKQGFVCRLITDGYKDYNPNYSRDMQNIFFSRSDKNVLSIWSYNLKENFFSNYAVGYNVSPISHHELLCTRSDRNGKCEIWKINIETGVEECVVSDLDKSFNSPSLSPDGQWILMVGSSTLIDEDNPHNPYYNTDIYVCKPDGSNLIQLTNNKADDLSPVWSNDGRYIYFVSQRNNEKGIANVWRMDFNVN